MDTRGELQLSGEEKMQKSRVYSGAISRKSTGGLADLEYVQTDLRKTTDPAEKYSDNSICLHIPLTTSYF